MARPSINRAHTNVKDWLDDHYEYIEPDEDMLQNQSNKPYVPKHTYSDLSPDPSDESSPTSAGSTRRHHDRYRPRNNRPPTPPSEDDLNTRDERTAGCNERYVPQSKEGRYPPRADHGRLRRPPINTATTSPDLRRNGSGTRHRRYSTSSSPTRHREDKSSRHHSRREDEPSARSTRHRDRDADRPQRHHYDHDDRSHRGGGAGGRNRETHSSTQGSSTAKSRRPSLSHTQTVPSSASAGHASKPKRSSFSFLNDPRFTAAATAAFQAGATAAVGAVGSPNAGAKVARAALGAAAMGAFKSPVSSPPPASPAKPDPGEALGSYFADRMERHRKKRAR
ncbi:hypothetical protein BD289DRAFT_481798 [Coniella lustricola]|uniref:Uncharacterized protein n=1 Tax=Coniella lustricola TaxID=2025994 RepID=A0A2T3AB37_9PEZI|nr:hypothetical protein BD289DRAFT_481798 [Coniella lustricola]